MLIGKNMNTANDKKSNSNRKEALGVHQARKKIKMAHRCPICNEKIQFRVEQSYLEKVKKFPFTHIVLHGSPVHILIVYIDANLSVRAIETSESLEISRDGDTFGQLIRKWSNPH